MIHSCVEHGDEKPRVTIGSIPCDGHIVPRYASLDCGSTSVPLKNSDSCAYLTFEHSIFSYSLSFYVTIVVFFLFPSLLH